MFYHFEKILKIFLNFGDDAKGEISPQKILLKEKEFLSLAFGCLKEISLRLRMQTISPLNYEVFL